MGEALEFLAGLAFLVIWFLMKASAKRKGDDEDPQNDIDWDDLDWGDEDGGPVAPEPFPMPAELSAPAPASQSASAAHSDPYAEERNQLLERFDALIADADALLTSARVERATSHISEAIADYLEPRFKAARGALAAESGAIAFEHRARLEHLLVLHSAVEVFIRQRRIPQMAEALGDADAIARACYEPMLEFAKVNLPELTSSHPVAVLTPFDLGIWTSFIPTGLAPLFLPPDFFNDLRWWPALAHEIGHDFLASTGNAEDALRDELGLPDERTGRLPLAFAHDGLHQSELLRVFGGWFEEIFCDVFGTVMMGPAYAYTMIALFAEPDAPQRTVAVRLGSTGRFYARHPPRTLRVHLSARALELIGEHEAAEEVIDRWTELHGEQDALLFPVAGGHVGIPLGVMNAIAGNLAQRLCTEQLRGLDGHSLGDIPGLEYGPHRAAEARRACDEILSGRAPSQHKARAVLAGAVLAWHRDPDKHDEILALARRAIVGVTEHREDAYSRSLAKRGSELPPMPETAAGMREAFVLHTILSPPPSMARMRRQKSGFLARRTWP